MWIRNVKIENFKCLENLEVKLHPFDCLVGANNSGKTTLLQALALFDFCVHNCLSRKNSSDLIELKRRSIAPEEFYVLPIASPNDLWTDRRTQSQRQHIIIKVAVTFDEGQQVTASIDLSYNRISVALESTDQSQEWFQRLSEFSLSYLPVFSTFLPQEERRTKAVIDDELARGHVNSVIRNLLLDLKNSQRETELVDILRRSFPELTNVDIEFDQMNDRYIQVTYREQDRPKALDIFSAGSGFQQFIYLFGFILLREPTMILLDEPDVHLHGSLQGSLLNELMKLVDNGKQVIFATHSRELIAQMDPENILVLGEEGVRRLQVAFDIYDTLDQLGSIEVSQLPVIQAYRRVLVVENKSDWDILSAFCATILRDVWPQVERRLAICYARGNPRTQDMVRLQQQLQQMIAMDGKTLRMFVVGDRDYHPKINELRASLPEQHLQWHIWERTEIENYLLSFEGIRRVLFDKHEDQKRRYEAGLRQKLDELIETSRDNANDSLVKAFQEYSREHNQGWDAATLSRKAREFLQEHWEGEKLALADAKKIVLPGVKRWAKEQGIGNFSDKQLATALLPEELPEEIHLLAKALEKFAGIPLSR